MVRPAAGPRAARIALALILLVVLALCRAALRLPSRVGTVVVVADRSLSMPPGSEAAEREIIDLLYSGMAADDRLAVVGFGQKAAVEQPPQPGRFAGFTHEVGAEASNLTEALEAAAALIPRDGSGRVLVLSDGRWTGRDPETALVGLASRGIAIDYRPMQRPAGNDLAIARIDAPTAAAPGESFLITAWVQAPTAQTATVELRRGSVVLASGQRQLTAGLNRLTFRDRAVSAGTQAYALTVNDVGDPVPENNQARFLIGINGPRPLLHVSTSANSGLARLCCAGGLTIEVKTPQACDWSLEGLSHYSAVILENVPADKLGLHAMEHLVAWVRETNGTSLR